MILCFSLSSCGLNKDEVKVNSKADKIDLVLTGADNSPKDKDIVTLKAKNTSDETITLDSITVIAYDKKLNHMDVSEDNHPVELKPNKISGTLSYTVKGKPAMIKVSKYKYTQDGKLSVDTFDRYIIMHKDGAFQSVFGNYTDKELLNKAYKNK